MNDWFYVEPTNTKIEGEIFLKGDKSITHRLIIFSSLAKGKTVIFNPLKSEDTLATLNIFKNLGVEIEVEKDKIKIKGRGKYGLIAPLKALDCKESGTTIRILAGLLSAQKFSSVLRAKKSLLNRPMKRVCEPLRLMGADIKGRVKDSEEFPPLKIKPVKYLKGIRYNLPVASAQVKSALILASLYAKGSCEITEPFKSRDHTERILSFLGADIKIRGKKIIIKNSFFKTPKRFFIPADISSASFFIALALLKKDSHIKIKDVSLNPTRIGFLRILKRMGAKIKLSYKEKEPEPYGDIEVFYSKLKSTFIKEEEVPTLIDELPLFMVVATQAEGISYISSCKELKVKETDRLRSMTENLRKMGAKIWIEKKGNDYQVIIKGPTKLKGRILNSYSDHRTFLSLVVAANLAKSVSKISNKECVNKSFPEFFKIYKSFFS